ncbi:hypothetical protein DL771_003217 [Monosporascus sp. 5C6A]|nr:hypothetical protein DL771_003217 [Monosporascus sp. 5C6A]
MSELVSGPDSALDEVKWQVAFFALVPLALGAMTQPVGRVLNTSPETRFWLRSSPFICVEDLLWFTSAVVAHYIAEPQWSWKPFKSELAYRFRDSELGASKRADIERAALGRWILIILGGIPCQTIKLLAMGGIPFTQAIALMFFISLILGEVLNLFAVACFGTSRIEKNDYGDCWSEKQSHWTSLGYS